MFILEEAGANFGNLDFQNKLSKMFTYILQSFRSMNLIVIMNLPVLTMLNKSARQLLHGHFITCGIDYQTKQTKLKPFFHQLNQSTGKSYWKFPRMRVNDKVITLQRLKFNKPSDRLIELYETNKQKFVFDLTEDFVREAEKNDKKDLIKMKRKELSPEQTKVMNLLTQGNSIKEIAVILKCSESNVYFNVSRIKKKGYDVTNFQK